MELQNKPKILTTLKKARSHLDKIVDMVEKDEYCIDIIQQINAVEGYLASAKRKKFADHLFGCFVDGVRDSKKHRAEQVEEILQILKISK